MRSLGDTAVCGARAQPAATAGRGARRPSRQRLQHRGVTRMSAEEDDWSVGNWEHYRTV